MRGRKRPRCNTNNSSRPPTLAPPVLFPPPSSPKKCVQGLCVSAHSLMSSSLSSPLSMPFSFALGSPRFSSPSTLAPLENSFWDLGVFCFHSLSLLFWWGYSLFNKQSHTHTIWWCLQEGSALLCLPTKPILLQVGDVCIAHKNGSAKLLGVDRWTFLQSSVFIDESTTILPISLPACGYVVYRSVINKRTIHSLPDFGNKTAASHARLVKLLQLEPPTCCA